MRVNGALTVMVTWAVSTNNVEVSFNITWYWVVVLGVTSRLSLFCELSVSVTFKGGQPKVGMAVKFATGMGSTITCWLSCTGGLQLSVSVAIYVVVIIR